MHHLLHLTATQILDLVPRAKGRSAMKFILGAVLALSLTLSVVPAIAEDSFQALSKMPATDRAFLTPLSDDQLASIEGATLGITEILSSVNTGVNAAISTQLNICILCTDVEQVNVAPTSQIIGF
jgi:hypothetical protein